MNTTTLLTQLSKLTGISGMESDVAESLRNLLSPYGNIHTTPLGSIICTARTSAEGQPNILLDAHMDEPGMIVTFIEDSGFLRVSNCGGLDRALLMASQVEIHTSGGIMPGVICSIPPHLQDGSEKNNPKIEDVLVDVGYPGDKCRELIRPGDRVNLRSTPRELLGGLVSGKALDNRAGCCCLIKVLELLKDEELNCGLSVVFSSMEEIGGQGAKTAAYGVAPTHAVVVDVSYAHTPDSPREKCGKIGDGPMVGFSPILSRELSDKLVDIAKSTEIPYQYEAMGGSTGTNADHIATTRTGVRTALVSIPLKYMHSPTEVVDPQDVDNSATLIAALVCEISG